MTPLNFGRHIRAKLAEALPGMPVPTISLSGPSKLPSSPPQNGTPGTSFKPQLTTTGSGKSLSDPAQPRQSFSDMAFAAAQSPAGQKSIQGLSNVGSWYARRFSPETRQTFNDMSANSARVSGGILSGVAGGIGTLGTGVASGATELWNAVTPKSMNTSEGWSQGVNNAFKTTAQFAGNGVRDVIGGLGGDTNYNTQHAWNQMEAGFNDPNLDPSTRNIATSAGYAGHGLWNLATAASNPGKVLGAVPGLGRLSQYGRAVNVADDLAATPFEFGNAIGNVGIGVNQALQGP